MIQPMARSSAVWIALLAFTVASCSTAINLRSEDYGRIDADQTYRIVMLGNREYTANHLVIQDGVASFMQEGEQMSVPVDEIMLIQQINSNELLTGLVVVGIAVALAGGLVLLLKAD